MSSAKMVCRVCGNTYEACKTKNREPGVFYWQNVSCSPECGAVYLQRINESRGLVEAAKKSRRKKFEMETPVVDAPVEVCVEDIIPDTIEEL